MYFTFLDPVETVTKLGSLDNAAPPKGEGGGGTVAQTLNFTAILKNLAKIFF